MLAKLIRYDLRSMSRILIIIHAFLLAAAFFIRFFISSKIRFSQYDYDPDAGLYFVLAYLLLCLLVVAANIGTSLIIGTRFYRNLFTDEGYLTQTLPVTRGTHLLSKTASGSLWMVLDMFLIYATAFVIVWTPFASEMYDRFRSDILTLFGFTGKYADPAFLLAGLAAFSIVSSIAKVLEIYAAVAVGQLFSSHRLLWAVVSYFLIGTVISLFAVAVMFAMDTTAFTGFVAAGAADMTKPGFAEYMADMIRMSGILSAAISVLLYVLTCHIMNRKIDMI